MSYSLRAFIGKSANMEMLASRLVDAHVVMLPHDFALIPSDDALIGHFEPAIFEKPFWLLPTQLAELVAEFSTVGKIGFEIDLFGGDGDRSAILWHNRQLSFGPATSTSTAATEDLFRKLEVPVAGAYDRFEALDLGQHRHIDDWLERL